MSQKRAKKPKSPWTGRRVAVAVLAAFMALMILLPMVTMVLSYAGAVTQSEIDDLKNEASALEQQKDQLENQLAAIQNEKDQAMEQKINLEQQLNVIRSEISNTTALIESYNQQIAYKEVELAEAERKEAEHYELFCQRVRAMEESGDVSYWSVLFSATSFSDLLDRMDMVNSTIAYNESVMEALTAAREEVAEVKATLETARSEQQDTLARQQAQQQELKDKEAQVDALMKEIEAREADAQDALDDLEALADQMDAEIARKQAELEAQLAAEGGSIVSESGYMWPLSADHNVITSLAGGRINPVTHKPQTHGGIDIRASAGTPIYASRSGVVITSAYNAGGYGNYVVISHGGGSSTLYAHMTSRAVSEGQRVSQGQVIGYVGSTGRSTAPHLHFEVRVNNVRQDPINYFPDKTLYMKSGGSVVLLEH